MTSDTTSLPALDMEASRRALASPDTFATVLLTIVLRRYGPSVFTGDDEGPPWDMIVLYQELERDFAVDLPTQNENKLQAVRLLLQAGDAVGSSPEAFQAVCKTLTLGEVPDAITGNFTDLTAFEVLWGMLETQMILGEAPDFSREVETLILSELQSSPEETSDLMATRESAVLQNRDALLAQLRELGVPEALLRSALASL
jgi:hypothetical protein